MVSLLEGCMKSEVNRITSLNIEKIKQRIYDINSKLSEDNLNIIVNNIRIKDMEEKNSESDDFLDSHTLTSASVNNVKAVRIYPNGSWGKLDKIVCNLCSTEKDKSEYKTNKYSCNECIKNSMKNRKNIFIKSVDNIQRKYNNNEWPLLEKIICNKCDIEKDKIDNYAQNRYTCISCVKEINKSNHEKYAEKSKEYSKKYRESNHGSEREKIRMREYYLKMKAQSIINSQSQEESH